jgi:hypothetical protein
MTPCLQVVQLAVCAAIHNISVLPAGRERVLANQGILRIFRSMDLHIDVRARTRHTATVTCILVFCRVCVRTWAHSILNGTTKGFVSYGGFTHVGFPSHTSLQLPLSPVPFTTFPSPSLML